MKKLYKYTGPVLDGNNRVRNNWVSYTQAYSKTQALNVLTYRYKNEYGLTNRAYIKLKEVYLNEVK